MRSIQRQLTLSVSVCMLLLCSIAVALSVYYHYNSRSGELDAQMVQTAKILDVLLIDQDMDDEIIQERLDALYNDDKNVSPEQSNQTPLNNLMRNFNFKSRKSLIIMRALSCAHPKLLHYQVHWKALMLLMVTTSIPQ